MGADWIFILVPVIAVVLLIIGGIMRGMAQAQEEERKRQQQQKKPRPTARPAGSSRPPATAGNELDRFLQEVQRRKQGGLPPAPAEPIPVAQVVEPRPSQRPPVDRPREKAPVPRRPRRRQEEAPKVRPVEEVIPVVEVVEERPKPKWEPQTVGPVDAAAAKIPEMAEEAYRTGGPVTGKGKPLPPAVAQLRDLLKNRQSLQVAMMLKEVLGPPKCKR